jgi:hypothetical protein
MSLSKDRSRLGSEVRLIDDAASLLLPPLPAPAPPDTENMVGLRRYKAFARGDEVTGEEDNEAGAEDE